MIAQGNSSRFCRHCRVEDFSCQACPMHETPRTVVREQHSTLAIDKELPFGRPLRFPAQTLDNLRQVTALHSQQQGPVS
jgi:hypothetical protein